MYVSLKNNNFLLEQPDGVLFSYVINGARLLVQVNDSAEFILCKLNGLHKINDIVKFLAKKYHENEHEVEIMVNDFINELRDNNLIEEHDVPVKKAIKKGIRDYYTPEHVTMELTHNCPLKCKHCFVNAGIGREIPADKCMQLLKELLNIGTRTFQLTGGEPFSYQSIDQIIEILIAEGANIHISTSGYILNKKVKKCLEMLLDSNSPLIQVSIDGQENTHNSIRGKNDAYDNTIKFIKYSVSKNIPIIVATTLIDQTFEEIDGLVLELKNLGVKQVRLGIITNQGRATTNNLNSYSIKEYQETLVSLKEIYDDEVFQVEELEESLNSLKSCGAGYKTIKITPYMTVTPCAMMQLNIGNLNRESLPEILKRSYRNFSRLEFPQDTFCSGCPEEEYCHDCISESIIRKNNVDNCLWEQSQQDILCALKK